MTLKSFVNKCARIGMGKGTKPALCVKGQVEKMCPGVRESINEIQLINQYTKLPISN